MRQACGVPVWLPWRVSISQQRLSITSTLPLKAVEGHEFAHDTPCLRDPDNLVYMREEQGGLVVGGYEPNPFARWIDGVPWEHGSKALPADYDRFEILLEGAIRRIPFLDKAGIITIVCHPGAYTR